MGVYSTYFIGSCLSFLVRTPIKEELVKKVMYYEENIEKNGYQFSWRLRFNPSDSPTLQSVFEARTVAFYGGSWIAAVF